MFFRLQQNLYKIYFEFSFSNATRPLVVHEQLRTGQKEKSVIWLLCLPRA